MASFLKSCFEAFLHHLQQKTYFNISREIFMTLNYKLLQYKEKLDKLPINRIYANTGIWLYATIG